MISQMDATKAELRRFFLGLSRAKGLGPVTIKEVLEECGDIQSLYEMVLERNCHQSGNQRLIDHFK